MVLPGTPQLLTESCAPTNGFIDAGETVTVNFGLHNVGAAGTSNLMATLLATNGVRNPSGPQAYGALATNSSSVYQAFTFQAAAGCGTVLRPALHLVDGTNDYGTVFFAIKLGAPTNLMQEMFDSTNAPTCRRSGRAPRAGRWTPWVTLTNTCNSAPNAAFAPDASAAGVADLESPPISINSAGAQLTFAHNYSLEAGYDGGVLEIKVGTNNYVDILAAGGSFESGGYDRVLAAGDGSNPLKGRSAWSGTSAGFIGSIVKLPAATAGQTIQLKWRCGTDTSNGGTRLVRG